MPYLKRQKYMYRRDGEVHYIEFERGAVSKELNVIGETDETGTTNTL